MTSRDTDGTGLLESSPANGEGDVATTCETILTLNGPLDPDEPARMGSAITIQVVAGGNVELLAGAFGEDTFNRRGLSFPLAASRTRVDAISASYSSKSTAARASTRPYPQAMS